MSNAKPAVEPLRGGIDLGGTKIQAVVVDDADTVLGSAREPTPNEGGPPDVAAAMADALRKAAAAADVASGDLAGVGAGSPGTVDAEAGTVSNARNLPDWEDSFELAAALEKALGTKVAVGHDTQVALDAEFQLGAGRPYDSLLGVFWGTGVGGGMILDGKPWAGRGGAGEIGHMVVELGGRICTCGRQGCLEAYAGRLAMENRVRETVAKGRKTVLFEIMEKRGRTSLTSGVWWRAIEQGDRLAMHMLDRAVEALGAGIASAVNLLDVEAVIIGGGMGLRFGEPYVHWIAEAMMPHLFIDWRPPDVHLAALGDLGGAIGAALLARAPAAAKPISS